MIELNYCDESARILTKIVKFECFLGVENI